MRAGSESTMPLAAFLSDTSGAVTVDWVVLAASVVGLGVASAAAVGAGVGALGDDVESSLTRARVAGAYVARMGFDDIAGAVASGWGWRIWGGQYDGWTDQAGLGTFELTRSGLLGIVTPDGGNMLDLDASPGNMAIGRIVDNLTAGETYSVTLNAADGIGNNGVEVWFGGERVGVIDPERSMSEYSFDFVAGSGDGSNELVITGTGPADNYGAYIHDIRIQ